MEAVFRKQNDVPFPNDNKTTAGVALESSYLTFRTSFVFFRLLLPSFDPPSARKDKSIILASQMHCITFVAVSHSVNPAGSQCQKSVET